MKKNTPHSAARSEEENTALSDITARLDALEAEAKIHALVTRYMEICDQLDASTAMDELASLFTKDAVWDGSGERYKKTFGGHEGRAAILDFMGSYRDPPHFHFNAHFLCSQAIRVAGDTAEASWMMLQTPSFRNGESWIMAAKLKLAFRCTDGLWQIARFSTTNLFGRKIEGDWNDDRPVPKPERDSKPESPLKQKMKEEE